MIDIVSCITMLQPKDGRYAKNAGDSITFPSHGDGNKLLPSGHLFVQGVGNIKVKLHRPLHGKIKTVSVKRQCEHWYVCFSVETSVQPLPESEAAVGIDVGLSSFAVLSDGSEIENPRLYQKEQKRLRRPSSTSCGTPQEAEETFGPGARLHEVWSHHHS